MTNRYTTRIEKGRPRKRHPEPRRCKQCGTKLSSYNPADTCYPHTPTRRPGARGQRR